MTVRPFLRELRDLHVNPYDILSNKHTAAYNANRYIQAKVVKTKNTYDRGKIKG
jgi:hypothetical protein